MELFLTRLAEILDVTEVRAEEVLRDFEEWDSVTVLSVMAMIDSAYGDALSAEDLAHLVTVVTCGIWSLPDPGGEHGAGRIDPDFRGNVRGG